LNPDPNIKTIALVSNTSWSIFNFRIGLARALKQYGFRVVIVAPRDNFSAKLVAEGFQYINIKLSNYGSNPLNDIRLIRDLARVYKREKIDFIFHYTIKPNIYGTIAAHLCGIPSIAITTGLGHLFNFKNKMVSYFALQLYRIAGKLCKEMWFLNNSDLQKFLEKGIVKKEKTFILPGEGINTNWFSPKRDKKFSHLLRFLFVGRLIWDKGVKQYVDAARIIKNKYPRIRFEMLGFVDDINPNSVPFEQINSWQEEKIIRYLGETTDVKPYLEKTSCLVFPSHYREGMSRILLEAAAMETPIITTDNVGCRDIVKDNFNGFLVPTKNVSALVEKIEEFINLPDEDKLLMGKMGRIRVKRKFEENKIIEIYLNKILHFLPDTVLSKSSSPTKHSLNS
jgi:glycosyltransferase involved in cell wall biosynthesis